MCKKNIILNNVPGVKILKSDCFQDICEKDFDLILSNPPYHADFSVPKAFIEKGFNHLKLGGEMLMVTRRREWYKNKFISIFGGVQIYENDGYFVFKAVKRNICYSNRKSSIT